MRYFPLLLGLAMVGCRSTAVDLKHSPAVAVSHQQSLVSAAIPIHTTWSWSYATTMPTENVSFSFEGSTNLIDWYQIIDTNQPPVSIDSYQPWEFYRVGAHWIVDPN